MANEIIREAATNSGVRLWQIADQLGITDATFSRKLRKEFSENDRERVLTVISEIGKEGKMC